MLFSGEAPKFWEAGYNVLPLRGKMPVTSGWQEWGRSRQAQFQLDTWCESFPNHNIGIPLGEANGIIGLDFDNDVDGLHAEIEALIPPSPVRKVGNKGYTAFYKWTGQRNKRWRKSGETVVELLSTGTQTVIPPSIHPDSEKPYIWVTEDTLMDIAPEDLPELPADFIENVNALFGIEKIIKGAGLGDTPDIEVVRHALQHIPAMEYGLWVEVGMALHHGYGDEAFNLWDKWSATAVNYDASKMAAKWRSFGKYSGDVVTAGSILYYAINYGWMPETAPKMFNSDAVIRIGGENEGGLNREASQIQEDKTREDGRPHITSNVIQEEVSQKDAGLSTHLLDAPGLVGELADWINSTSIRRQPALALGASITAVGMVMAHRFRTPTDLRSNMMTLGICGPGLGKDHARKCINMLFECLNIGEHLMGDFASDTAIINGLSSRGGIGMTMTDEIGDALSAMGGRNAGSHEVRIMRLTKELFSSANTLYRGKEYANHDGKMEAKVVNQPCLCIYGTSTPGQFFDALTGKKVLDGFLPRWLVFEGDGNAVESEKIGIAIDPPNLLIERFSEIWATSPYAMGSSLTVGQIKPLSVDVTDDAWAKFRQLKQYAESNRKAEYEKGSGFDALYARVVEHAWKLALVGHTDGQITSKVAAWACELMVEMSGRMVGMARDKIGDNDYERDLLAVVEYIRFAEEGCSKRELTRKFRRLPSRDLNNLLAHACESGMVEVEEMTGNNNRKTQLFHYSG